MYILLVKSVLLKLAVTVHVAQIMSNVQLLEPTRPNFCVVDMSYLYVTALFCLINIVKCITLMYMYVSSLLLVGLREIKAIL